MFRSAFVCYSSERSHWTHGDHTHTVQYSLDWLRTKESGTNSIINLCSSEKQSVPSNIHIILKLVAHNARLKVSTLSGSVSVCSLPESLYHYFTIVVVMTHNILAQHTPSLVTKSRINPCSKNSRFFSKIHIRTNSKAWVKHSLPRIHAGIYSRNL